MVEIIKNTDWVSIFLLYLIWPGIQQALLFLLSNKIARYDKKFLQAMLIPGGISVIMFAVDCFEAIQPAGNTGAALLLTAVNVLGYTIFMIATLMLSWEIIKESVEEKEEEKLIN